MNTIDQTRSLDTKKKYETAVNFNSFDYPMPSNQV